MAIAIGVAIALSIAACGGSSTQSSESASTDRSQSSESAPSGRSSPSASSRGARALAGVRASILHYGKEGTKAESAAAAQSLSAFFLDRDHKFWAAACSYLAAEMRHRTQQVGGKGDDGCGRGVEALTAGSTTADGEATIVAVKGLRREGGHGFLIYTTEAGNTNAMLMDLEAGEWRLAGVNPTPLFSS